ncbi:MAG: hypothetical protein EXX96DRAFT_572441 [Benjaminiella poitrasii]|nr:MAG: hypothetical protein EXX96DRAFT_572441 [Benjaminiella poitrasii]
MSDSAVDSLEVIGEAPVTTTERTRLLNTTSTTYSTRQEVHRETSSTSQTVITVGYSVLENGYHHLLNTGSTSLTTTSHVRNVILEGQPTIPPNMLIDKIQDILVFSEIKKKQQERSVRKEQRKKDKKENDAGSARGSDSSSSSSSSSSSDSDSDNGSKRLALKKKLSEWSIDNSSKSSIKGGSRLRKRDLAVDTIKFATDRWKERHGWSIGSAQSSSINLFGNNNNTTTTTTTTTKLEGGSHQSGNNSKTTVVQQKKKHESQQNLISSAESIFNVAKNASVCAVLALLHERRQSSGHSTETDLSLQTLALSTLSLGLKLQDKSVSQVVLYEMLTNKWINGKSALDWAIENDSQLLLNDARVQLVIQELWQTGPNWRQDPSHPSHVWIHNNRISIPDKEEEQVQKYFFWFVICRTFTDYLARWPSAKYQSLNSLFSALIYLGLHLATVTNQEYTSDVILPYELAYYVFVFSDFVLLIFNLLTRPCTYLRKVSSYISLVTISLLASSFIIRVYTLLTENNIEKEFYYLNVSYALLVLSTPLMFFRAITSTGDLCWNAAKATYTLRACFVNSIWVFALGIFIILGFWVALGALQYNDISPFAMLRLLVLGALHTPEIGDTLHYQPKVAGLLLAFYLFLTVVVLGSLLSASFISTILDVNSRLEVIEREWVINRCLRSKPALNSFTPSVLIDIIFYFINYVSRVVFKRQAPVIWLEKIHQVLWYIIYSPIILLIGFYEVVTAVLFKWHLVRQIFKRNNIAV